MSERKFINARVKEIELVAKIYPKKDWSSKLAMLDVPAEVAADCIDNDSIAPAVVFVKGTAKPSVSKAQKKVPVYTFGVEIECIVPRYDFIDNAKAKGVQIGFESYNHVDSNSRFKVTTDASVRGGAKSSYNNEIVSPILKTNSFKALELVCKSLNECGAKVNKTTGLHVHIGAGDMDFKTYKSVFLNYLFLEEIIDASLAPSRRANSNKYCLSLAHWAESIKQATDFTDLRRRVGTRYTKVNAYSYDVHKTIEFRQHQGSTNFTKIKNWVKFLVTLVEWSKDNRLSRAFENTESDREILKDMGLDLSLLRKFND